MAEMQPQAAYTVLTKGLSSKWSYHLRASSINSVTLAPLDEALDYHFLPALLGQGMAADSSLRKLLSLPTRFGGLAIPMVAKSAEADHQASLAITASMVNLIDTHRNVSVRDSPAISPDQNTQSIVAIAEGMANPVQEAVGEARGIARQKRHEKIGGCRRMQTELAEGLSPVQRQLLAVADEKGVSTWLTAQPSWTNRTVLKKSDFRDALCIRYGLPLDGVSDHCVCGKSMTTHHALTCPTGGYPSARHNELRDLLAGVLQEVLPDVEVEPHLLPLHGEDISAVSANRQPEARLDIRARGFWSRQQDAYFDVRVTDLGPSLLSRPEILSHLRTHERMKKAAYGARVNQVERASFTPLVFSTSGVAGKETSIFLKSLAALVVDKNKDLVYSAVMGELRTRVSFCLLRWAVTCFRGCRASYIRRRVRSPFAAYCRRLC